MSTGSQSGFFVRLLKSWYGDFSREELVKVLKLSLIFALTIGVYWTMRPFKNVIFTRMAGKFNLPVAKWVSLATIFPLVIIYSKLVDRFDREKLFYVLGTLFALGTVLMGYLFLHPTIGLANASVDASRFLPWFWYVFSEAYGSLLIALFWAFANDMMSPKEANKGFPIVVMLGQLGSIFMPYAAGRASIWGQLNGLEVEAVAWSIIACGLVIVGMMAAVRFFVTTTPKSEEHGFHGVNEAAAEKEQEPGFLEGFYLMIEHKYLLGILGVIAINEIIATIIDFQFQSLVCSSSATLGEHARYLQDYAMWVNAVTFLCIFFGVSNIQRRLGITVSLTMVPVILAGMVVVFWAYTDVDVLFYIMVGAKALSYAINSPAQKQLYIPTTKDVRYKSQAWIEAFGSRGSKAAGSGINSLAKVFMWFGATEARAMVYLINFASAASIALAACWFSIALYLGRTYNKAVDEKKVIC